MFTGIVEEVGSLLSADLLSSGGLLTLSARTVLEGTRLGDSIAVNGACLTVTSLEQDRFSVGVMPETLRRTNLGRLREGDSVNLERALQSGSRLGGHFVQGHVDGVGRVTAVAADGNALAVRIAAPHDLLRYVVEKGFIAVDGASLTVTAVDSAGFGVGLIPYTRAHTAPALGMEGHTPNLEVDILAKYVERLVVH